MARCNGLQSKQAETAISAFVIFHKKCDCVYETSSTYSHGLIIKNATAHSFRDWIDFEHIECDWVDHTPTYYL